MKILFLSSDNVEHMADFLFHGLVELYGHENIIDYPRKPRYHMKEIKDTGFSYLNWCQCLDVRDSYYHYSFEEIKTMVNNKEVMIVSSIRARDTFYQIKDNTWPVGTVLINGEDDSNESWNNYVVPNFQRYWNNIDMVLQREYKVLMNFESKVIPFPCPSPVANFPILEYRENREIDVFCILGDTHPFRKKLRDKVASIKGIKSIVTSEHMSFEKYFETMNNSKICIAAGGAGWESTHYLDIPYARSMLLAQSPADAINRINNREEKITYPNNFIDRKSAVFYKNDLSNIESLIRYYLANETKREEIVLSGYEHLNKYLTTKAIAEYVIKSRFDFNYWKTSV